MAPFFILFFFGWHGPTLVAMSVWDNKYTNAQVGDTGGLFESLDPAPCGAVPAFRSTSSSSSLLLGFLFCKDSSSLLILMDIVFFLYFNCGFCKYFFEMLFLYFELCFHELLVIIQFLN